jgi:BirA family transcriptional regulator, biotin operon repressor / biotin---[acetyl-CoA-carboxylase] ligase
LKSSRSDDGTPFHRPPELAEALDRVRSRLARVATSVTHLASLGSTNDVAMAIGTEGAVVIAEEQVAGRGRRGHTWFSPPGSGLYTSIVLAPSRSRSDPARATALLTLAIGVAIVEGIDAATGLRADLKWPNDVYVGSRKLAGILAEASGAAGGVVVAGYGINVAAASFPQDVAHRATSIETELGRPIDRFLVLAETLAAIESRYADLLDGRFDAILDAWRRRAPAASGRRVSWTTPDGVRTGVTAGVDSHGALLVRIGGETERIVSGEVDWGLESRG